jgi:cytoplasmic iron level regulating protein YaaA (DUF328/UPF0246 family)
MLTLLSPAKTLDCSPAPEGLPTSQPILERDFALLLRRCKALDVETLQSLMRLSQPLAELTYNRFQEMTTSSTRKNSKACLLAFRGDVYRSLDAPSLSADDLLWAQSRLRIISGLYGVLRPLDLMQPYRLEMGTRLDTERGATLYDFWGDRIAKTLNAEIGKLPTPAILNLASNEYSKAIPAGSIDAPVVNASFKEYRDGALRTIGFFSKQARGLMARYVVENRVEDPRDVTNFDLEGYAFDPELSTDTDLVFTRQQPVT